jgi:uncharacterized protein YnzC (UPF0291/DUF896 family)
MTESSAIKPTVFSIPDYIAKEDIKVEDLTEEEKTLATGARQAFWKTLKRHVENEISILDQINDQAVAQGLPIEEIGKNTVIISLTKGVIKKIFDRVEDAREAQDGRAK